MNRGILMGALLFGLGPAVAGVLAQGFAPLPETRFYVAPELGYRLGGEVKESGTGRKAKVRPSESYGLILGAQFSEETSVELLFGRQSTEVQLKGPSAPDLPDLDLDVEYYHIGPRYEFTAGDLRPFMRWTAGVTRFKSDDPERSSSTHFSTALTGGLNYFLSEHVALRFDAGLYASFVSGSTGVYCGGGRGCGFVMEGPVVWQGDLSGALMFVF